EFHAWYKIGRVDELVVAVQRPGVRSEGKIKRQVAPRRLLHGVETRFRGAAQHHAVCRTEFKEAAVVQGRDVEAVAVKIVGQKNRAADIGTDGFFIRIAERQPEGHRGKLIQIGDKAPAVIPKRLHFQLLLVATLILAVLHSKIGVANGGVLKRAGAKCNAFARSASAEVLESGG